MLSAALLIALAAACPLVMGSGYGVGSDTADDDEDNLVTYQCDSTELLVMYNRSEEYVKMHCSPPAVCGQERTCVTSVGPSCSAKSQYLAGVKEESDGSVVSTCCQLTPPVQEEEPCQEIEILDQALSGREGAGLMKVPPPEKPGVEVPAPRVASLVRSTTTSRPTTTSSGLGKPITFDAEAEMMLSELKDRRPPIDLVKSIRKIPKGYRVQICTPICSSSTTSTSTPASSTNTASTKSTTDQPTKPTPQHDQRTQRRETVDKDGHKQITYTGGYCREGFQQCQSQCRTTLGVDFLTAACVSAGDSDTSTNAESGKNGGGSRQKDGSSEQETRQPYQKCVCTERKQKEENKRPVNDEGKKSILGGKLGNGQGCFSGDMMVTTASGRKRMDQLHVGDEVLVLTSETENKFQPIEWFYHRDVDQKIEFINLETASGQRLSLTPNHLIPLVPCSKKEFTLRDIDKIVSSSSYFASRSKVGHCIAVNVKDGTSFRPDPIVRITRAQRRGVFSPITSQGTIVVNGIQASCYSSLENQPLQRAIHSILINANRIAQMTSGLLSANTVVSEKGSMEEKGVPPVLVLLLQVAKTVLPSYVYL